MCSEDDFVEKVENRERGEDDDYIFPVTEFKHRVSEQEKSGRDEQENQLAVFDIEIGKKEIILFPQVNEGGQIGEDKQGQFGETEIRRDEPGQ